MSSINIKPAYLNNFTTIDQNERFLQREKLLNSFEAYSHKLDKYIESLKLDKILQK